MTSEKKYQLIERFLSGIMTDQEKQGFEKQLEEDPSLQQELDLHRQIETTLKGEKVHQLRDVLKKVDKNWQAPEAPKEAIVKTFNFKKILSIAAAVLVLLVAYQFFSTTKNASSEALFADNFQTYKMVLNQRTLSDTDNNSFDAKLINQGISAYEEKNFALAAATFQKLQEQHNNIVAFQFYRASSELSLENTDIAIRLLEEISSKSGHLFVEQTQWYLALAYLQKEENEKARLQLQAIPKGAYQYDAAQKILNAL